MAGMSATKGDVFKPGDIVKQSGIYRVVHDPVHHKEHEVTCVYGKKFPPCRNCGRHVRFVLERAAMHIENHKEFKN